MCFATSSLCHPGTVFVYASTKHHSHHFFWGWGGDISVHVYKSSQPALLPLLLGDKHSVVELLSLAVRCNEEVTPR